MTLQEFAANHCDGMHNPHLGEEFQCGGWYQLKKMVQNQERPNLVNMQSFHPNIRTKILEYWDAISKFHVSEK